MASLVRAPGLVLLRGVVVVILAAALPTRARAVTDVPIGGERLKLRASQERPNRRSISFRSALDPAIAAPFPDPSAGASLLVFSATGPGGCRAEIALPAAGWKPIGGDGAARGWRYRGRRGGTPSVRDVVIARKRGGGRIVVQGGGGAFPCGLEAPQRPPVFVALRLGDVRYCAAFGGTVRANEVGSFRSGSAPAAECPDTADVTVATLNVLHGLFCPPPDSGLTPNCRLEDRLDLLGQWIVERGCPDVVALQEVTEVVSLVTLVEDLLVDVCDFPYESVYEDGNPFDNSLFLTRYPPLVTELALLYRDFRNVLYVRLDHPTGPVDVFSTHLASGSDGAMEPCGMRSPCPPECTAAGVSTVRECQAVQLAELVADRHDVPGPAVVVGDLNASPGSFEYGQLASRGWVDAYLAAGNPECEPSSGSGCTSGRDDDNLVDLESPAPGVHERIDYVFLVPPSDGSSCAGVLDSGTDADGDGVATRHFADEPNPFAASCGPAPDPVCWVSDHNGVQADVNCE